MDLEFGGFAFGEVADCENEVVGAELGELEGGVEAEAGVGAGYDDCFGGEGGCWVCGWVDFMGEELGQGGHLELKCSSEIATEDMERLYSK